MSLNTRDFVQWKLNLLEPIVKELSERTSTITRKKSLEILSSLQWEISYIPYSEILPAYVNLEKELTSKYKTWTIQSDDEYTKNFQNWVGSITQKKTDYYLSELQNALS